MTAAGRFTPADFAVLRIPTLPHLPQHDDALRVLGPDDSVPALRQYCLAVSGDLRLREAVELASAALADDLRRVEDGAALEQRQLLRIAMALTRYRIRATTRPTPFGLFAGVVGVQCADDAGAAVDAGHRKHVMPDMGWLLGLVRRLETRPAVFRHRRISGNDLCTFRGERLVLPYLPSVAERPDADLGQELVVRANPMIRAALAAAEAPCDYADLVARLRSAVPAAGEERIERLVANLIAHGILLTDLCPPPASPDPLGMLIRRLDGSGVQELPALRAVAAELARYAGTAVGAGRSAAQRCVAAMRDLLPSPHYLQVDLRFDADVRLPPAVGAEAAAAAEALWQLSPPSGESAGMRAYHRAFLERYGVDRLVPLVELLDPHRGLDAPVGYLLPVSEQTVSERFESSDETARGRLLAQLAQAALARGDDLVLDDDLVTRLRPEGAEQRRPPAFSDLWVRVLAPSAAALDAGDFELVAVGGGNRLGSYIGRFGNVLPETVGPLVHAVRGAMDDNPGVLAAQLRYRPRLDRMANVIRSPQLTEYTVAVGVPAERDDPTVLGVRDLLVGADEDRLYVVSRSVGCELMIITPDALNPEYEAPNAVRFLREAGLSGQRTRQAFGWGSLDVLAQLPRVRYRRTVLAPARWRPDVALFDQGLSWQDWSAHLAHWRKAWSVPVAVRVGVLDQWLELDLDVPLHQRLLREELRRRPDALVEEAYAAAGNGWLQGHCSELVVPLRAAAEAAPPARPIPIGPRRAVPSPTDALAWTYVKLPVATAMQDEVLTEAVPSLLSALPGGTSQWFFVRYMDPAPHLRLRFRGPAGAVTEAVRAWAASCRAQGLAAECSFHEYDPEIERYGGAALIEAAERVFHADSTAVLAQLRLRQDRRFVLSPALLAAANVMDLVSHVDPDWERWFPRTYPATDRHSAFRAVRRQAISLLDAAGGWPVLRSTPGGPQLLEIFAGRAASVEAYGAELRAAVPDEAGRARAVRAVLHMHVNRLLGYGHRDEPTVYAMVRGVLKARADRLERGNP